MPPTRPVGRAWAFQGGRSRSPLRIIGANLRHLRFGVRGVGGGRGRRSGSRIANLEVSTSWATHASPLHRSIDATAPGMPTSAPVPFLCGPIDRNRRKSAPSSVRCSRCRGAVAVDDRGRRWFTWRCLRTGRRRRRPYTDLSTPRRLGCRRRRPFRSSAGPSTVIGANLRHLRFGVRVSGVVAVDDRGRRWFTWRCLRTGRRMRRPYTDMPPTRPVGQAGVFHGGRFIGLRDGDMRKGDSLV